MLKVRDWLKRKSEDNFSIKDVLGDENFWAQWNSSAMEEAIKQVKEELNKKGFSYEKYRKNSEI